MTAVMNFISWDKAYAIFPVPTFVHRKTFLLRQDGDKQGLRKYDKRGWKLQKLSILKDRVPSHTLQPLRRVGDEFTWVIPFAISNVKDEGMEIWEGHPDSIYFAVCNPSFFQPSWFYITTD